MYKERLHRQRNQNGAWSATERVEGVCYLSTLHVRYSFSKGQILKTGCLEHLVNMKKRVRCKYFQQANNEDYRCLDEGNLDVRLLPMTCFPDCRRS